MRVGWLAVGVWLVAGCDYISASEFDDRWDRDGDGWGADYDCNDDEARIYPGATDSRGDGCDADCGVAMDRDGDDWPDSADCNPNDATIHPCAADTEGDTIDADCDGADGPRVDGCPSADPSYPADQQLGWEAGCVTYPVSPVALE